MNIATLPLASADTAAFCEGARLLPVRGVRGGQPFAVQDWVAEEVPVALEYNGISHAVMLATPLDLEDFALGFSLSEGILEAAHELYGSEIESAERGITVVLTEHDMDVIFGLADRLMVLNYGEIIATGTVDEVRANPMVREVYLGKEMVGA